VKEHTHLIALSGLSENSSDDFESSDESVAGATRPTAPNKLTDGLTHPEKGMAALFFY